MINKVFLIFIGLCLWAPMARAGDDCLDYKLTPRVTLTTPLWRKEVVQPLAPMDLWHGNVIATLADNYEVGVDLTGIEDGWCVALKSVDAAVGYEHFLVHIDGRHAPGSCAYNAILTHEDEHIRAYLSVMDELADDMRAAVTSAANAVMPVFVRDASDIDAAIDELHRTLQAHPDLILMHQRIGATQEIKNKAVDQHDDGSRLRQCGG
ncbi:hypothetical protein HDR63_00915 [bacterium]|nr:hypothetical protein [bacterium]